VYRVAFEQAQLSDDCYGGGAIPVNEQDDSSSLYAPGTVILYMGADEVPYLDLGAFTLAGDGSDDAYTFDGATVDVEFSGAMDETRIELRSATTIKLNIDGAAVEGTWTQKDSSTCTGSLCPDPADSTCTATRRFTGSEVEDVDLKHEV